MTVEDQELVRRARWRRRADERATARRYGVHWRVYVRALRREQADAAWAAARMAERAERARRDGHAWTATESEAFQRAWPSYDGASDPFFSSEEAPKADKMHRRLKVMYC